MMGWLFSSSATTEGTRFEPSSPGITTGLSPCIKATREFVVPRSMPTMRSDAIDAISNLKSSNWQLAKCQLLMAFQYLRHIPNQVPDVVAAVQHVHHSASFLLAFLFGDGLTVLLALDHS